MQELPVCPSLPGISPKRNSLVPYILRRGDKDSLGALDTADRHHVNKAISTGVTTLPSRLEIGGNMGIYRKLHLTINTLSMSTFTFYRIIHPWLCYQILLFQDSRFFFFVVAIFIYFIYHFLFSWPLINHLRSYKSWVLQYITFILTHTCLGLSYQLELWVLAQPLHSNPQGGCMDCWHHTLKQTQVNGRTITPGVLKELFTNKKVQKLFTYNASLFI